MCWITVRVVVMVSTSWPDFVAAGQQWIRSSGQFWQSVNKMSNSLPRTLVDFTDFYFYLLALQTSGWNCLVIWKICSRVFTANLLVKKVQKKSIDATSPSPPNQPIPSHPQPLQSTLSLMPWCLEYLLRSLPAVDDCWWLLDIQKFPLSSKDCSL